MKRPNAGRAALFLSLAAAVVAATALAAGSAMARTSASDTFVIDNSFTIKTADPQRAFDPTASLVDRAIYDTLFTYKGSDLAHPVPLLVSSWKASIEREDVHVPAEAERALRRRDAAHLGRRRLLAPAARQPEGQPGVPARGRHGHAGGQVHGRDALEDPGHASCRRSSRTRRRAIVNSALVKQHGGTDAANAAKTDKAEQWLNSSGLGRRRQRPVHAQQLQHHLADHARAEHELLGHEEARVQQRRRPQHDRADAAASTSRAARTRSRSISRPTRRRR